MPNIRTQSNETIHYIHNGTGPQTVLFIHGNLANTLWWEETLEKLPQQYTGYALDLPGSGKTPETGKRHTIEYFVSVVKEFADSLNLTDLYLVGHSMGGGISQLFTLTYPEMVKKAVLVDSMAADGFHVLYNQGEERLRKMMKDRDFLKKAIQAVAPMCRDEDFINRATDAAFNASEQVFLEQPVTMHEANWMNRLGEIHCPVLFLHGELDHFVPQEGSVRTASAIPECTFKFLPKCGHSPMVEIFPEFYREIFDFLFA